MGLLYSALKGSREMNEGWHVPHRGIGYLMPTPQWEAKPSDWLPTEADHLRRSAKEVAAFFEGGGAEVLDFVRRGGDRAEVSAWYQVDSRPVLKARKSQLANLLLRQEEALIESLKKDSTPVASSPFAALAGLMKA